MRNRNIIILIVCFCMAYFSVSFIQWELNPENIETGHRFLILFLTALYTTLWLSVLEDKANNQ